VPRYRNPFAQRLLSVQHAATLRPSSIRVTLVSLRGSRNPAKGDEHRRAVIAPRRLRWRNMSNGELVQASSVKGITQILAEIAIVARV